MNMLWRFGEWVFENTGAIIWAGVAIEAVCLVITITASFMGY